MRAKNLLLSIVASIILMTGAPVSQAGNIDDIRNGGSSGPQGGGGGVSYPPR